MYDKEEFVRLNAKIKTYEAQLDTYRRKIAELEGKLEAYEQQNTIYPTAEVPSIAVSKAAVNQLLSNPVSQLSPTQIRCSPNHQQSPDLEIVPYEPAKSNNISKKRGLDCVPRPSRKKHQQAPRWIAAGQRVIANVKKGKFSAERFRSQNIESSEPQGSLFERGKTLAERAAHSLRNATYAATKAQTELFFFLSALCVLETHSTLSSDEIDNIMMVLESRTDNYRHRRSILHGAKWFHDKVIVRLCERGWKLGHAIAVVALSSPDTPSQYEHVRHDKNADSFIQAFENVKDDSKEVECIGLLLFRYIELWNPFIRPVDILTHLYSGSLSPSLTITNHELDAVTKYNMFALIHPEVSPPTSATSALQQPIRSTAEKSHDLSASLLSNTSKHLLDILHILAQSAHVEYSLLLYAGTKRKRWTPSGELEDFSIGDIGFDYAAIEILRDAEKLDRQLCVLESKSLIKRYGGKIHILHNSDIKWAQWKQAAPLICFYFTGCEYSNRFSEVGNCALPSFQGFFRAYKQQPEDQRYSVKNLVLPALVQASKFSNLPWKKECIDEIGSGDLQAMDLYTHASFVVRKAYVLRSDGRWDESSLVIRKQLCSMNINDLDPRLNAVRGLLVHSLASNMWEREKFDEAVTIWGQWQPPKYRDMTLFETRVSTRILTGTGKVMLHQGNFQDAMSSLESALRQYDEDVHPRLDVLATLTDVYCELGNPKKALEKLRPVINLSKGQTNRYYRNCYVSYVEALIWTHNHEEAEGILLGLKKHFGESSQLDRHDRRRYIRVLLQLAQNLHLRAKNQPQWMETGVRWRDVVASVAEFDEISCWDLGMISFSMHHASLRSGTENSEWLERGINEFKKKGRFWMRGMATYWGGYICSQLPCVVTAVRPMMHKDTRLVWPRQTPDTMPDDETPDLLDTLD